MNDVQLKIIVDSREGDTGYSFSNCAHVQVIRSALPTGDYSLSGFEDRIALERKTISDLIQCLGRDRDRFERELTRARNFEIFAVICEFSLSDVTFTHYRSHMKPQSILQSIAAFSVRYRVSFLFCGDRSGGELMTYSLLSKFAREVYKRFDCLQGTNSSAKFQTVRNEV